MAPRQDRLFPAKIDAGGRGDISSARCILGPTLPDFPKLRQNKNGLKD